MQKRTANVHFIHVNSVSTASIFNIGDSSIATPVSKGIAVQQERAAFGKNTEVFFKDYPIFRRQPNWNKTNNEVISNSFHHMNTIHVKNVMINAVAQSSIAQIGSIDTVYSEARIKHIRRLRLREQ